MNTDTTTNETVTTAEAEAAAKAKAWAAAVVAAYDNVAVAKAASKAATERLRSLLPYATEADMRVVLEAARTEAELPEGCRVGQDFVLTDAQQMDLLAARAQRKAELAGRKAELVGGLMADKDQILTSFKVRVGTKKTTTVAKFEKGRAGNSLIAKLRAMRS